MTDVEVPGVRNDAEFVEWLDGVIAGIERDLAEAEATVVRLTRALPEFRRARRIFDGSEPVPPRPAAVPARHSCPHCPKVFGSGAGLGGHMGKAHPGAKRLAAIVAAGGVCEPGPPPGMVVLDDLTGHFVERGEPLSKTTIDHADAARQLDAALANAVAPVDLRSLVLDEKDGSATEPPDGALRCILEADDKGACGFVADDASHLDRHLRRRHQLCGGDDPDDVEYRAEQVRNAQAAAGQPATYGLGVA